MSLWDTIRSWVERDAQKLTYIYIPEDRTDVKQPVEIIEARKHYFRIWLAEMHLKRDREWFKSWYPVAHTLVRFQFGEQQVEVANVAGPLKLRGVDANNLEQVVKLNYPMTTLMPFRGGVVEVMAGLFAMKAKDFLQSFLGVMEDFSELLVVPQLSSVLKVASPVVAGVEKLLAATDGQLHLGIHQAYVGQSGGGNLLKPGYYAVVRAEESRVDPGRLWIKEDRLRYGNDMASSEPYKEFPHMVFRIEGQLTRDDWDALTTIAEPRAKMIEALAQGKAQDAQGFRDATLVAVFLSPDLSDVHKRALAGLIRKEFEEFGTVEEAIAEEVLAIAPTKSLAWAILSAPPADALSADPVTYEELFASEG